MFRVEDDDQEEPQTAAHIIPGPVNDSGDELTFSEHLTASSATTKSDEDDEEDEALPKPLI